MKRMDYDESTAEVRDDLELVGAYRNTDGKWLFNMEWQHARELIKQGCSYTFGAPEKNPEMVVVLKSKYDSARESLAIALRALEKMANANEDGLPVWYEDIARETVAEITKRGDYIPEGKG